MALQNFPELEEFKDNVQANLQSREQVRMPAFYQRLEFYNSRLGANKTKE